MEVLNYFVKHKVRCVKYNNCLDQGIQKQRCFDSFLQLTTDKKKLILTNKVVKLKFEQYDNQDEQIKQFK